MVYVTSDLHGYPLKKLQNKLEEIEFNSQDHLYILGDCIDRGPDGLEIIRWIMSQSDLTLLLGNHEVMLLDNQILFDGDSIPAVLDLKGKQRNSYCVWTRPTFNTSYYEDGPKVIFGHSPTVLFGSEFRGKPVFTDTWINNDVGAGIGLQLRLDDMKRFYI